MNEITFWSIIEKCHWSLDYDYNRISNELLQTFNTKEEIFDFITIADRKKEILSEYLYDLDNSKYSKWIDESDDGLSDLISHIIGLGEKTYNKCINNHKEISKYTRSGKNSGEKIKRVENFFYSFHDLRDKIEDELLENYEKQKQEEKIKLYLEELSKLNSKYDICIPSEIELEDLRTNNKTKVKL